MLIGKVIGTAVATRKHPVYDGKKVMVIQPTSPDGKDDGKTFLAVDSVQAGIGDRVLVAREGNTARQILKTGDAPVHAIIVGIIDDIHWQDEKK